MSSRERMDSEDSSDSEDQRQPGVLLNVFATQYDVVSEVGKQVFRWKLSHRDNDKWDVCWIDTGMTPERLIRMKPYQKINHFPGMHSLARKNCLAGNLQDMQQALPGDYDFFPQTWLLPRDFGDLKKALGEKKTRTYIVKPEAECQGRGIFLTRELQAIPLGARYVVQRYIHKPYLIEGLKFDMRIYVLVTGCDPLRIFVHEEGLARFATEPYVPPFPSNLADTCMHLTNYAINKDNSKFVYNTDAQRDDVGHKRSLRAVFQLLQAAGHDTDTLWTTICGIIVKTLCSAQPLLAHIYRSCQPLDPSDSMCFEILGVDILLDHNLKPWLLEVNHSPSFTTDTPLDHSIKKKVIADALRLLDISRDHRDSYNQLIQDRFYQQVVREKKTSDCKLQLLRRQDRAVITRQHLETHCGGFRKLFPLSGSPYQLALETAQRLFAVHSRSRMRKGEDKPKPKTVSRKPRSRQEPLQEEPRKRASRPPRVSSVSLDQSLPRAVVIKRLPEGSFVKPKILEFGLEAREEKRRRGPLCVGWKIREMLRL